MTSTQRTLTGVLFLLVAAGFLAPPTLGQEVEDTVRVSIEGRVIDSETGDPVHLAVIQILDLNLTAFSDEDGVFQLPDLPRGSYSMTVTKLGYGVAEGVFLVEREGTFQISLIPDEEGEIAGPGRLGGRITDHETERGISGATVSLTDLGQAQITNSRGSFQFRDLPPGLHALRVEHLGYATREDTLFLLPGQSLQVDLVLGIEPIPLEGITVSVRSRILEMSGFYSRMNSGYSGRQWSRADIEERNPLFLRDLIRTVPGVGVARRGLDWVAISHRGGRCRLAVYVDGMEMRGFDFDLIHPEHVEALEIYHGVAGVPIEYSFRHPCGVMLIWLRHGV